VGETKPAIIKTHRVKGGLNTGKEKPQDRQAARDDFQAGKLDGIVGTIKAMGTGVTLTRASHVMFAEIPMSPGVSDQAEDRLHRKGQTKTVFVWYSILTGSIDEDLVAHHDSKRKNISKTVDGVAVDGEELFKTMMRKGKRL
jgi:SNF2 family DNA or RNA helicase